MSRLLQSATHEVVDIGLGKEIPAVTPGIPGPDVETASNFYRTRFAGAIGDYFLEMQTRALLSCLGACPHCSVLDIGGGHGQYSRALIENGFDLTVLGSSPDADIQIRTLVESNQCRFITGDLLHFPFPDHSFDYVISFRLLAHLKEWHVLLSEMTRTASQGVVVDYPNRRSFNVAYPIMFELKRNLENESTRTFTVFRDREVASALRYHGFHTDRRIPQFLLPMVFHRKLKNPRISRFLETSFRVSGITRLFGSPVILKAVPDSN